jgi:hypothetical protein
MLKSLSVIGKAITLQSDLRRRVGIRFVFIHSIYCLKFKVLMVLDDTGYDKTLRSQIRHYTGGWRKKKWPLIW